MAKMKFRRGEEPYTHHHVVVQIGFDGVDLTLDLAVDELDEIASYVKDIDTGLKVLDIENEQIRAWMDAALWQIADTKKMLDSLVDKLLDKREVALVFTESFGPSKRNLWAEATKDEHEAQLKAIRDRHPQKDDEIPF